MEKRKWEEKDSINKVSYEFENSFAVPGLFELSPFRMKICLIPAVILILMNIIMAIVLGQYEAISGGIIPMILICISLEKRTEATIEKRKVQLDVYEDYIVLTYHEREHGWGGPDPKETMICKSFCLPNSYVDSVKRAINISNLNAIAAPQKTLTSERVDAFLKRHSIELNDFNREFFNEYLGLDPSTKKKVREIINRIAEKNEKNKRKRGINDSN